MEFLGWTYEQWLQVGISALIVALALVLGRLVVKLIVEKVLRRFTDRSKTNLDDTIIEAAEPLIYWLIVFLAVDYALSRLDLFSEEWVVRLDDLFFILYFALGFIFLWTPNKPSVGEI